MSKSSTVFVGMDVHKESIDITLAEQGGEVHRFGQIGGDRPALMKAVRKLTAGGRELVFVYEAGLCGFWIHRALHEKDLAAGYGDVELPDALERKYPSAACDWKAVMTSEPCRNCWGMPTCRPQ